MMKIFVPSCAVLALLAGGCGQKYGVELSGGEQVAGEDIRLASNNESNGGNLDEREDDDPGAGGSSGGGSSSNSGNTGSPGSGGNQSAPPPAVDDDEEEEPGVPGIACKNGKKKVCHYPPGNHAAKHAICVGAPAVPAHVAHGDALGDCPL